MLNDFFNLIFPITCSLCNDVLFKNEDIICLKCQLNLPKTNYHLDKENTISKIFWGRVDVEMVASYLYFSKKGQVQHLLHELKYKGNRELGIIIGKWYGQDLKRSLHFENIDVIIPVPLHARKKRKRGYNQSEYFAKGLSKSLNIPINISCLIRKKNSNTQTDKGRYKRWENVKDIFQVKQPEEIIGKSILLVDDVVTTGATLEACSQELKKFKVKIFIATIASV